VLISFSRGPLQAMISHAQAETERVLAQVGSGTVLPASIVGLELCPSGSPRSASPVGCTNSIWPANSTVRQPEPTLCTPQGTYRAPGPASNCYWERLRGFGGAVDDIIANNNSGDPSVVTIAPTDKGFRTSGCGTWTSDLSAITSSKTSFPAGTYIVNTDIKPGTYSAPGGTTCYWARLSGFGGTLHNLIANENPTGHTVVTIAATDKGFESVGCGTFKKS
jgi:hypothetical protein